VASRLRHRDQGHVPAIMSLIDSDNILPPVNVACPLVSNRECGASMFVITMGLSLPRVNFLVTSLLSSAADCWKMGSKSSRMHVILLCDEHKPRHPTLLSQSSPLLSSAYILSQPAFLSTFWPTTASIFEHAEY